MDKYEEIVGKFLFQKTISSIYREKEFLIYVAT